MLIEERVRNYLEGVFQEEGIPVVLEIPEVIPDTFVLFQLVDRERENQINAVTLEFRSYAPSKYEAAELDEMVRDAMDDLHATSDITCQLGGGNDAPDTTLKRYRYRCYYNLFY